MMVGKKKNVLERLAQGTDETRPQRKMGEAVEGEVVNISRAEHSVRGVGRLGKEPDSPFSFHYF